MANDDTQKFLLGAFGILTAALTAFGVVSGTIDRIERNHSVLFWIGAVAVLVAVSLAVLAGTLKPVGTLTYWRWNHWTWAAVLALLAVVVLAIAAYFSGRHVFYVIAIVL